MNTIVKHQTSRSSAANYPIVSTRCKPQTKPSRAISYIIAFQPCWLRDADHQTWTYVAVVSEISREWYTMTAIIHAEKVYYVMRGGLRISSCSSCNKSSLLLKYKSFLLCPPLPPLRMPISLFSQNLPLPKLMRNSQPNLPLWLYPALRLHSFIP